jgi:DNA-binding transcriptional ArsR family regulator
MNYSKQNHALAVFKALANVNRINILKTIHKTQQNSLTVNEIAEQTKLPQPKVSDHLKLMRISKIVKAKQDGTLMHYSINDPFTAHLLSLLD